MKTKPANARRTAADSNSNGSSSTAATAAGTPRARSRPVRLECEAPSAAHVCVAGTFNDWHPGATEMVAMGDGHWVKEITLPPGTYEYRLVVDGQWIADPKAREAVANPFGGTNSVLHVTE